MDKHPLQTILENADYSVRSYSGRGMYGDECLGVDVGRGTPLGSLWADVIDACVSLTEDHEETAVTMVQKGIRSMEMDSMGLGRIVYFPGVPFVGTESEDDEEDS